ncbi:beta-propeller domain-containing protein [Saliphagus infecundisoli]|uniref:Beta-propeller domain-containing protein n=1 Tax=Saliphagus infecundisoli TaxID=1849069 RepID=A0ABD5QDD6_9EURY|nr:beta-propeller domain-containing protein [Saliphagus infecundisoli]
MASTRTLAAVAVVALLVGSAVGLAVGGVVDAPGTDQSDGDGDFDDSDDPDDRDERDDGLATDEADGPAIDRFDSAAAFATYLQESRASAPVGQAGAADVAVADDGATETGVAESATVAEGGDAAPAGEDGPARHSETNVQVEGIDEPDLLKSDGETVYYAGSRSQDTGGTHVLDATEPADPKAIGEIPADGELLLANDSLVALESDRLRGYDVSEPAAPEPAWSSGLEGRIEAARLAGGDLLLVVAERADPTDPCPVEPLGGDGPAIDCTDVSYPADQSDADTVYTAMRIDPASGEVEDDASFLGSGRATATYVSGTAIYLTYADTPDRAGQRLEFLLSEGREYLDDRAIARLEELQEYDLSEPATRAEIAAIEREWRTGLDRGERRTAVDDLEEAWETYVEDRKRSFSRTGIVKLPTDSLSVAATGSVAGTPLDQWAMDEHDGNLRIATTVAAPGVESENDLVVLDSDLDPVGAERGMGEGQEVFAARYQGDTAYLVTFRRVDPFHVIDLSEPTDPTEEGELELPGFSTYLHPLGDDRVLGIGEEGGSVKAVVFDASDPTDPVIENERILDDRWSAVRESHTAFLIDERHGIFFLPGSQGGHVFDYEDGLERVRTVETDGPALRAMYVEDYLYVFGDEELVVVDETTWEEEAYLDLRGD